MKMTTKQNSGKKIAYIIGTFPYPTTTFIDREILEAIRQGLDLILISIRQPEPFKMKSDVANLAQNTRYLLPVSWIKFIWCNLFFLATKPGLYGSTLFYLITRKHKHIWSRVKTVLHFAEGVWATWVLKEDGVDHIHAHFADRAATVALVVSRLLGKSYSLTAHANDIYVAPVLLNEKIKNAKFTTTCTSYNKTYLEKISGCDIELIYHGIDIGSFKDTTNREADQTPLILSVGQLKEKKGFHYLVEACRILKDKGYVFKCEIIGEGPYRSELEELIKNRGMQDSIELKGALPLEEVLARYQRAIIFVLACVVASNNDRDGIPNVILEAMAHRVPVVSTSISGIPEVVQNNHNGLLVDPENPHMLSEALISLLESKKIRTEFGLNGQKTVMEQFDLEQNTRKLVELFM